MQNPITITLDGKKFESSSTIGNSCTGCYFDENPGCHRVACGPDSYSKNVIRPNYELNYPIIWKEVK